MTVRFHDNELVQENTSSEKTADYCWRCSRIDEVNASVQISNIQLIDSQQKVVKYGVQVVDNNRTDYYEDKSHSHIKPCTSIADSLENMSINRTPESTTSVSIVGLINRYVKDLKSIYSRMF